MVGSIKQRWVMVCAVAFTALWLGGCGIFSSSPKDKTADWSAEKLYAEAEDEAGAGGWAAAIKLMETLQSRYPFGRYAQQAQMEIAYFQWKDNEPEQALAAADRFLKQYPNHQNADYVYYLKGLINFNDDLGLLSSFSKQDLTERDPKSLRDSFDSFHELVVRFPNSRYTPDATSRMRYLVNALASHEIHVAQYYLKRGAYLAALNRSQDVVKQYQEAPAVEDALKIMVQAYGELHMDDLRDDAQRVLDTNYPNNRKSTTLTVTKIKPWWRFW